MVDIRNNVAASGDATSLAGASVGVRNGQLGISFVIFVIFLALSWFIAPHYFEFTLEPDVQIGTIAQWRQFFVTFDMTVLPNPYPYSYFDGSAIPCALIANVLSLIVHVITPLKPLFPNYDSFSIAATVLLNVLALALGSAVFFAMVMRLTGNRVIATAVSIAFYLAPQMIAINIIRVDYEIQCLLVIVLYECVRILQGSQTRRGAVVLGASIALAATIKNQGIIFGVFPCIAVLMEDPRRWVAAIVALRRYIAVAVASFVTCFIVLMFRYVYHYNLNDWITLYPKAVAVFLSWKDIYKVDPGTPFGQWGYYNIWLMQDHGYEFVILYFAAAIFLLIASAWRSQQTKAYLFFLIIFVPLSLVGVFSLKYQRGGYHLLPFIYAIVALALSEAVRGRLWQPLRYVVAGLGSVVLAISLVRSAQFYVSVARTAEANETVIKDLWGASREWMASHVAPGSTACIHKDSGWALPPVADLHLKETAAVFDFPYTNKVAIDHFEPPKFDAVDKSCDIVLLDNTHATSSVTRSSLPEVRKAWSTFYATMDTRYKKVAFTTNAPTEGLKSIDIYVVKQHKNACTQHVKDEVILRPPFAAWGGNAYAVSLPKFAALADSAQGGERSPLVLCQGDRELGPAHTAHTDISQLGGGRYSHWGDTLVFSTQRNENPNIAKVQLRAVVPSDDGAK